MTFDSGGYPLFDAGRPGFLDNQELTVRVDQDVELAGGAGSASTSQHLL